jgi:ABC-type Fe3+-hydroxamate transport system substrate-binding protein
MPVYTDQLGKTVLINSTPHRIISVVPSITELLFDLGLRNEVAAITKFCVHPQEWFRSKPRIGGTKQLNISAIKELNPDLVIANKEENVQEQIEEIEKYFPVFVTDVNNTEQAYQMIEMLGTILDKNEQSVMLINKIRNNFQKLPIHPPVPAAYLIWKDPLMTVGGDTFIHSMMQAAGFQNVFAERTRYPKISIEDLNRSNCDILLLSSEPFPFNENHINEIKSLGYKGRIKLVDGEMFSWYGSRMYDATNYFCTLHPL